MTLSHGYLAVDHYVIGVVDDTVNYRIGDQAVVFRVGIYVFVPALSVVLCAEDHRLFNPCFNDLQQIVCIIWSQLADKSLVEQHGLWKALKEFLERSKKKVLR